jgi:tetratricopeptide (TPR) repeat protein
MVASGEFEKARSAHKSLGEAAKALQQGESAAALAAAEKAEANNPGFYQNAWLRGLALLGSGRNVESVAAFEAALAAQPAFQSEKQEIETSLQRAKMKQ